MNDYNTRHSSSNESNPFSKSMFCEPRELWCYGTSNESVIVIVLLAQLFYIISSSIFYLVDLTPLRAYTQQIIVFTIASVRTLGCTLAIVAMKVHSRWLFRPVIVTHYVFFLADMIFCFGFHPAICEVQWANLLYDLTFHRTGNITLDSIWLFLRIAAGVYMSWLYLCVDQLLIFKTRSPILG